MKQYLTLDRLHDIQLSDDDLFAAITDNTGNVLITPWVMQLFYELLHHPRILFFDESVDREEAKEAGLVTGHSSTYLPNMATTANIHDLFFIINGIYSFSTEGLIVSYSLMQPRTVVSLQRKKLIDEYLIDLE